MGNFNNVHLRFPVGSLLSDPPKISYVRQFGLKRLTVTYSVNQIQHIWQIPISMKVEETKQLGDTLDFCYGLLT